MNNVTFLIAALILVGMAGTGAAAVSLSNSGSGTWNYEREISIKENSGTTLTDYQVLVELKGADFPSEAQSSGADIRFTDASGNELSYWIESWDYAGKSTKMWVKVPSIRGSGITTMRLYYGNPSATSSSNGNAVFEFFDDFDRPDSATVGNGWTQVQTGGTASIESNQMKLQWTRNSAVYIEKSISGLFSVAYTAKIKQTAGSSSEQGTFIRFWGASVNQYGSIFFRSDTMDLRSVEGGSPTSYSTEYSLQSYTQGTYYTVTVALRPDGKLDYYINGVLKRSGTTSVATTGTGQIQVFQDISNGGTSYADYVYVRKYTPPEPTLTIAEKMTSTPTPTTPAPTTPAPTTSSPTPTSTPSASVQLHGEKTDVSVGEDIIFKLSAVNKITKPEMTVQVILIPPSGMSVTSSEFATSGAGQYTTTYKLDPGAGRDIEVRIKTNQQGDFNVKGEIVYYYGDDKSTAEEHTLNLPIKVREISKTPAPAQSPTIGFWISILIFGISYRLIRRHFLS